MLKNTYLGLILMLMLAGLLGVAQAGNGGIIDVYTQNGGIGPDESGGAFAPQDKVVLYALVTYNEWPMQDAFVYFKVNSPTGFVAGYNVPTDGNGIASIWFRIPPRDADPFGTWEVSATVLVGDEVCEDIVTFEVQPACSWEYVFEDAKRSTILKISTDDRYFQFIAPDDQAFSIREVCKMKVGEHSIFIWHKDDEIKLFAVVIDTEIDFCFACAKDMGTGDKYLLIDRSGTE